MRISLSQSEALHLASFIVENQEQLSEGIHISDTPPGFKGLTVEARGDGGKITAASPLSKS